MDGIKQWLRRLEESERWKPIVQFVKFGMVGAMNTLVYLAVYWLCLNGLHWHEQAANIAGFLVSVVNAYYWNSRYVFRKGEARTPREHARAFVKTLVSYGLTGLLLNAGLLWLWVNVCHISANIAPILNLLFTIPINFVLNKLWAFSDTRQGGETAGADATSAPAEASDTENRAAAMAADTTGECEKDAPSR